MLAQLNSGYLTVLADQDSLPVYVDDDYAGRTPLLRHALAPDEYNVGFFPQDSLEEASWRFKEGSFGALWQIARYSEGIVKVRIAPDSLTRVELNYRRVEQAPGRAKLKVGACLGGTFILGVLSTLAVEALID